MPECNRKVVLGFNPNKLSGIFLTEPTHGNAITRFNFFEENPNADFLRVDPANLHEKCRSACRLEGDKWTIADRKLHDKLAMTARLWSIKQSFGGHYQIQNYESK